MLAPLAGVDLAGKSVFDLAVLEQTGVAGELLPRNPASAWLKLNQAARAGNMEALLALSDRFSHVCGGEAGEGRRACVVVML